MGSIKNKAVVYAMLIVVIVLVTSCFAPTTKEAYLKQFESFVENVGEDYHDYSKNDWKYANERFQKFSKEWHVKFEDDFTLKEKLKVAGLIVKYKSYKGGSKIEEFYDDVLKEDVDKMKDKIEYYIENDMTGDLENLKKGAKEIGDSLLKVVEDIIDEINN